MTRYHLVSLFLLLLTEKSFGQSAALFFRSADIENARSDSPICDIRPQKFGNYILIKYMNGDKTKITKDSVWGFRSRKGRLYRMYKGEPYQVIVKDGYIKYYYYDTFTISEPVLTPITETRYSATLNSPIVLSKKKARRKKGNPLWIKQTNRKDTLDQKQVHSADRTVLKSIPQPLMI